MAERATQTPAAEACVHADEVETRHRELIARIAHGDPEALAELGASFQRSLFYYLLRLIGDASMAEEVLQDTLLAAWNSAHRFERRSTVQTWLLGIARRQAHNTMRRRSLPMADFAEIAVLPARDPVPEAVVLAGTQREELATAMSQLSSAHREVLVLIFGQGLSYAETAQVAGVPEGTIKSRLSNAKRALRVLLAPNERQGA
ncbi:MAG TPA: sigma-70 family RNA polymerase sigma factor [Polyangiaceae bacterium]|jgi:RNA polymerase sigma-70 factor (ECF subfamily)